MFENVIWYLKGYVRIRVTGYSPERFLNACRYKKIYIWNLKRVRGAYEMNLTIDGFRRLKEIVRKTDTKVLIIQRNGLPFLLHRYRKRYLLFGGILLCMVMMWNLSGYIWNVDIKGNSAYTKETLKRFLASQKVEEGMRKKQVDCQKIVQELRKHYDKIIWVSASVDGCRLVVRIKENEDGMTEQDKKQEEHTDLVATENCRIIKVVTRSGTPNVHPGDTVKKGDTLVFGQIAICNDEKEVTGYRACSSDADIIGETSVNYQRELSETYPVKKYYLDGIQTLRKREYAVRIGTCIGTLGQTKNTYEYYVKKTHQMKIRIANVLPVIIERREILPYKKMNRNYSVKKARAILSADFHRDCKEMEKNGVEIIQNDVIIYTGSGTYYAKGTLRIRCSVAKQVPGAPVPVLHTEEEKETKNGD